jgi:hypothetical protein
MEGRATGWTEPGLLMIDVMKQSHGTNSDFFGGWVFFCDRVLLCSSG